MFILFLGPSKSGKSRLAERLAYNMEGENLLYVATMIPVGDGEAGDARVTRHREQREGLGFTTLECPVNLSEISVKKNDIVLLEDVSNLLANNLFSGEIPREADEIIGDIVSLSTNCKCLVVVSFTGVEPSDGYDEGTNKYVTALNATNQKLWELADTVITVEKGTPAVQKGELDHKNLQLKK